MRRNLIRLVAGVFSALLLLELVMQILPVSTATLGGRYVDPMLLTYPSGHRWVSSTAWDLRNVQHLQANNLGFVAGLDFVKNPAAVALIGDSMVEASMLNAEQRPAAQLASALTSRPIYALPGPGSSLLDYAERIRWAHEQLDLRDFIVFLERGDLIQAVCGSGQVHGPCFNQSTGQVDTAIGAEPGWLKRVFRHSASAQYFLGQLKLSPERLLKQVVAQTHPEAASAGKTKAPAPAQMSDAEKQVARLFFERVKPHVRGRLLLVMDGDRASLYQGQTAVHPRVEFLTQLAQDHGAQFMALDDAFANDYRVRGVSFDVGPYDAHLNPLGVGVAMTAIAQAWLGQPGP